MGILLRRYCLAAIFFFSLVSLAAGSWDDLLQKEFPKTPWSTRPRVEQNVCIDCHASDLMKEDYKEILGDWRKSWHYQNVVGCQGCHGGDPRDAALSMKPESGFLGVPKYREVPEFCGKCHIGILENFLESGHGKALKTGGKAPNCVVCHGSHDIPKADINIIREDLCGVCHSYDRARTIKATLLLTEKQINKIENNLKVLQSGLISTEEEGKVLFRTQAEFRALFHTVDVNLVQKQTGEFAKRLSAVDEQVRKGFRELRFRQDFSLFIMLAFLGLGITIFFLSKSP